MSGQGANLRVLLVEDNSADEHLLRQYLHDACAHSIELVRVDCLKAGLDQLKNDRFDAVVLDLELPDSRGIDTFETLRVSAYNVPIVVLTGINDQELALRAVQRGAQDYLCKSELDGPLLMRSLLYAIERQRLNDHIQMQARQLERDRARNQFLGLLAHELRNPMSVVKAILTLVRVNASQGALIDDLEERVATAEREMDRISCLLNEVLDAFQADKSQLDCHCDLIDLKEVVKEALRPFKASESAHYFECLAEEGPIWVRGDSRRLEQVVRNLLENAVKYSPHGGTVRVTASARGDTAVVCVQDEGMGVPADQIESIFDAFYQASNVIPFDLGGLGLGLFICKAIISQHGGEIGVSSEEGRGATFYFRLPLCVTESNAAALGRAQGRMSVSTSRG